MIKFASLWHKHLLRNHIWNFRLSMSALTTVTRNTLLEHELFTQNFCIKLFHISNAVANTMDKENQADPGQLGKTSSDVTWTPL